MHQVHCPQRGDHAERRLIGDEPFGLDEHRLSLIDPSEHRQRLGSGDEAVGRRPDRECGITQPERHVAVEDPQRLSSGASRQTGFDVDTCVDQP